MSECQQKEGHVIGIMATNTANKTTFPVEKAVQEDSFCFEGEAADMMIVIPKYIAQHKIMCRYYNDASQRMILISASSVLLLFQFFKACIPKDTVISGVYMYM